MWERGRELPLFEGFLIYLFLGFRKRLGAREKSESARFSSFSSSVIEIITVLLADVVT